MTQKQWDKLKPATKRVKIAQDVIDRVTAKQYKPTTGIWAQFDDLSNYQNDPLQPLIQKGEKCSCCALGGLMVSRIALENKANTTCLDYDILHFKDSYNNRITSQGHLLQEIFDSEQLALIETAYEMGHGAFKAVGAARFGRKYRNDKSRLIAIMQNIIDNKGTFKP